MRIDTYIKKEDKVSQAKFLRDMETYPVGTYIKFAERGCINDISSYVWGKVRVANGWRAYSSIIGGTDIISTDREVQDLVKRKNIKNIGVKFPSCT